ncbi:MAG: ABC transporter substrate-binding protein [Candidatus Methanoperedens sp.]|nr:ABC transporter substrate-binding protein [Candidatus Methanoperedens sp.]MCZ7406705.1 ABC transporter substrate-binding protein [Candidatus Methanoperedens sp.]
MSRNIKLWLIALIVVAFVGAGFFFTKAEKPKEETVAIRILDSPDTVNNWEIAKKLTGRDFLAEEGVKLELITSVQSTGGTQSLQALLANNIDYGSSFWPAWINIIAAGGQIKAVLTGGVTNKDNPGVGLVVLENSTIYTAKDLIGKKISINVLGAERDYVIRQYLKQNGLSIDQVQLIVVPWSQQEQVLRSGQVDVAGSFQDDYFAIANERGGLREIPGTSNYAIKGTNLGSGQGFRKDFIKEHPETVKRFITVYEKSQRFVWEEFKKDPEHVKKAYAEVLTEKNGNPKRAKYYKGPRWSPEYPFATDRDIQYWLDIFESEGKLKPGQIKPSDVYTHEFNPFYKEYIEKKGVK